MKKLMWLILSSMLVIILTGCGGDSTPGEDAGGGSSGGGTNLAKSYSGTASPGDFAKFAVSGDQLDYNISGSAYGSLTGSLTLQDLTGNGVFFNGSSGNINVDVVKADNLGIFVVPTDDQGNKTVVLGLQVSDSSIDESKIAGKSYIYADMGIDNGDRYTDGYIVTLKTDHTLDIGGLYGGSADGCWKALGNHIGIKIGQSDCTNLDDTTADARVIIKTATEDDARAGFIVDGSNSIGVGVELKELAMNDLNGTFDALNYDFLSSSSTFMEINVTNDGTHASFTATPYNCNAGTCTPNSSEQISGNIDINQICTTSDTISVPGVMCVTVLNDDNEVEAAYMGFIDPKSGYFVIGNDDELIFGSKHH